MVYKPDPIYLRERSKEIINARNWGIGLVTTLLGIGMFISEVERIRMISPNLMNYAYLALFLVCGILIFLWIWSTQKELNLLFEWLDPQQYDPPSSFKETILILSFAVLLIGLLFASRNPLIFGCVFTLYNFAQIFAGKYLMRELGLAIQKSRERLKADFESEKLRERAQFYREGLNILDYYYFKRPQQLRIIGITIFSILGLALAIWWYVSGIILIGFLSYLVFIITITVSEIVIAQWRIIRDNNLRPITAELREINRGNRSHR